MSEWYIRALLFSRSFILLLSPSPDVLVATVLFFLNFVYCLSYVLWFLLSFCRLDGSLQPRTTSSLPLPPLLSSLWNDAKLGELAEDGGGIGCA